MNLSDACWAKSKVRANTWHLFYAAKPSRDNNADTCDGSACGMSGLSACEAPTVFADTTGKATAPPGACAGCLTIWDSWVRTSEPPTVSPYPEKQSTATRKQRRQAAHDASCEAYTNGATPEEAVLAGRRAYAAAAGLPLPTKEDIAHETKLAKNLLAGLSIKSHPPLINTDDPETP